MEIVNGWKKAIVSEWKQADGGVRWCVRFAGKTHTLKTREGAIRKAESLVR